MKGSIRFDNDINIEVDVDKSAEEGAKLTSAVNLVDGQELGGGGGGIGEVVFEGETEITNNTDLAEYLMDGATYIVYVKDLKVANHLMDIVSDAAYQFEIDPVVIITTLMYYRIVSDEMDDYNYNVGIGESTGSFFLRVYAQPTTALSAKLTKIIKIS